MAARVLGGVRGEIDISGDKIPHDLNKPEIALRTGGE